MSFTRAALLAACACLPQLMTQPALADPPIWPYPDGAPGIIPCPPGYFGVLAPATTCTASTTHHETDIRTDLPNVQVYATTVLGSVFLTGPGLSQSVLVFNQTTPNAPGSPAVLSLFNSARAAIHASVLTLAAGRPFIALPQTGPVLIQSSSTTGPSVLVSHMPLSQNIASPIFFTPNPGGTPYAFFFPDNVSLSITTSLFIGPGTYITGPDLSSSVFIPAGTTNLNALIHYEAFFEDDFQATTANAATYGITDTILLQLIGTIHPAVQSALFDSGGHFLHTLDERASQEDANGGWAQTYGSWSLAGSQGMVPGVVARSEGISGGLNIPAGEGFTIGLGADQGWSQLSENAAFEHADLRLTQLGLNAAYASGAWRFDLGIGGGLGDVDTQHGTAAQGGIARASYGLALWGAQAGAGYRLTLDDWSLTPKLGLDWTAVHSDAFGEIGGPALSAGEHTATRTRGWLGIEAAHGFEIGTQTLDLSADARIIDVLSGRGRFLPVGFAGSPLRVDGLTEDTLAGDFEATAAVHLSQQLALTIAGQVQVAGNGDYTAGGRVALSFDF